jgi:acetyl-CoA carboxylase biotin carboxyl carrier protein
MQPSEFERIKRVVDAFERSDWSEVDVRVGDLRIHLAAAPDAPVSARRPDPGEEAAEATGAGPVPPTRSAVAGVVRAATDRSQTSGHPTSTPAAAFDADVAGAHVVTAPTPGIFWRSPEPGTPPFAAVGDAVDADDTVCIIEVMKLMSHVKAGVAGRVVAVHGENGVAVAKDAPLFTITPEAPPVGPDESGKGVS